MTELVRVSLDTGEVLVAEVDTADIVTDDVVLASPGPGKTITQLSNTLESGLQSLSPALSRVVSFLKQSAPTTIGVEFGMKLGGETGVILAKGTVEANFTVKLEWRRSASDPETTA